MPTVDEVLEESAVTYNEKSKDYGNSWQKIGDILLNLSHGEPITLETPEDFVAFGLFTRRLDKFARAFHGEFVADEMNFESVTDAHEDEAVYAAMASVNYHNRTDDQEEEPEFGCQHSTRQPAEQ